MSRSADATCARSQSSLGLSQIRIATDNDVRRYAATTRDRPYGEEEPPLAWRWGEPYRGNLPRSRGGQPFGKGGRGMSQNDIEERTRAWIQSKIEAGVQAFFDNRDFPQSEIEIVAPSGTVRYRTKAIVHAKSITVPRRSVVTDLGSIIIPDPSLIIECGDESTWAEACEAELG